MSHSYSSRPKPPSKIAGGRFEIGKKLGAGCFGEVYRGVNKDDNSEVAIKFEDLQSRTNQLETEHAVMKLISQGSQAHGFAECFYFGREGHYHALVMELLGKSLEHCVQSCGGKFKPQTATLIAIQCIQRIEYLHSKCIIHRDIKPENFMWGTRDRVHHLYIIDFGLSKRYWDKAHCQIRDKLSLTGTARYASINAHKGFEQSRRDDLEAIGHMLLYFLRGSLPWSGLDAKTKEEKYRKIRMKKEETALSDLCHGYPKEFQVYLQYSRDLEFKEKPDYKKMHKLFGDLRGKSLEDHQLEWIEDDEHINKSELAPLPVWKSPPQPDDAESNGRKSKFCFCFGKGPRDD
jgi:serine/threonine protein kinase